MIDIFVFQGTGSNATQSPIEFRFVDTPTRPTPAVGRHDSSATRSFDADKQVNELKARLKEKETSHHTLVKQMKETEKMLNDAEEKSKFLQVSTLMFRISA